MANPLHSLCFLLYFHLKYKESLLLNKKTSSLHKKTQETVVFSYIQLKGKGNYFPDQFSISKACDVFLSCWLT